MGRKKTKFTPEFKAEAVKLVTEQGYKQIEVANNLGVDVKNIHRWVSQKVVIAANAKSRLTAEQEELQQLRKEIKRLRLEREILKKAATFFANELS